MPFTLPRNNLLPVILAALLLAALLPASAFAASRGESADTVYAHSTLDREDALSVNRDIILADAVRALAEASNHGLGEASVTVRDATGISLATMKSLHWEARWEGIPLTVHADNTVKEELTVRLSFDPQNATQDISLFASSTNTSTRQVREYFEKHFSNRTAAIALEQSGEFGMPIHLSARVDLSGMDPGNLVLYYFDRAAGTYTAAGTAVTVDGNGFIHADIDRGGYLVISDGALARK